MALPHFSPFTPELSPFPPEQISSSNSFTPSPNSPILSTPSSQTNGSYTASWKDNARPSWTSNFGDIGSLNSTPNGSQGQGLGLNGQRRNVLGSVNTNLTPPSLNLSSPFVPGDPNGVWGPPMVHPAPVREMTLEERLSEAEKKIRELSIENRQLKETQWSLHHTYTYSYPTAHSLPHSLNVSLAESAIRPGYGYTPSQSDYGSPMTDSDVLVPEGSGIIDGYRPPLDVIIAVLQGTFDFNHMHQNFIRPVVWVIAHCQPGNASESIGLKSAVNALASHLTLPRDTPSAGILIDAINEWAKDLCFTSCGNYLCQQLLERGDVDDKQRFIDEIRESLVSIASDKFGTHVLCKAVSIRELEESIADALLKHGVFDSLKTGARRLWREYLEKCRQARNFDIFTRINDEMAGKWADLACVNEHGSIAVQQVFEIFGSQELMEPCFVELLADIARIANNQFGHFVISKLVVNHAWMYRRTWEAIIQAYPPVATSHHGVGFAKNALGEGGRASIAKYIEAICSTDDGRTPGIVSIATSSVGKAHIIFLLSCLTAPEHMRLRQVCRAFSTTLRNSQSGNDLLRHLGLIHAVGSRGRTASICP